MRFLDFLKRKRRTLNSGYTNYRRSGDLRRKAVTPKKSFLDERPNSFKEKLARRKSGLRDKFLLGLKVFAGVAVFSGLVYLFFFTGFFEIKKIEIKGNSDSVEDKNMVNEYLQKYLGKNIIMFSSMKHETTLEEKIPYIKNLNISRNWPDTLTATLETFPMIANLRVDQPDGSSQFYIVNELGFISTIGVSNEELPTIVMDVTGTDFDLSMHPEESGTGEVTDSNSLTVHQELIPQEMLETILKTKSDFEGKFNLQLLEVYYLKRAKELHLLTELEFYVWIDMTQDIDLQLAKLKKGLTKLNIYEDNIEYIDLRVTGQNGEKIIYKLKD